MGSGFDAGEVLIELQEHVLRQFLGYLAVAQKTQRQAEDHRLVVSYYRCEIEPVITSHICYYGRPVWEIASLVGVDGFFAEDVERKITVGAERQIVGVFKYLEARVPFDL